MEFSIPYSGVCVEFGNSHGVSLPDSGVFIFNFNTIKWNFSGVLLVCEEY